MIIVDFSQVLLASVFVFSSDFQKGQDTDKMKDILRHVLHQSLLSYKRKYTSEYGEMIIACDGEKYWRKDVFPQYKANRKKSRETSTLDWENVFAHMDTMKAELRTIFPWKVIEVPEAEGDDIMGVMTKYALEHGEGEGLFDEPKPILLITSDGDMKQLHELGPVKQWSPHQKKLVAKPEKNFLLDKIIRGDAGDGIPSVLSPDDWFTNSAYDGIRAKPVTKAVIERFSKGLGLNEEEKVRYERNRVMVDLDCTPEFVTKLIIEQYETAKPSRDTMKIMTFLQGVRAKQLLEIVHEYIVK